MPKKIENVSGKIMESAMEIYRKEGYEGISIRKISSLSGIAVGTVYSYYADKETLIAQIFSSSLEELKNSMMENIFLRDSKEALYGAVFAFITNAAGRENDVIRYALDLHGRKDHVSKALSGQLLQIKELLCQLVIRISEENGTDVVSDSKMLTEMLYGMIHAVIKNGCDDAAEKYANMICGMVCRQLEEKSTLIQNGSFASQG